MKKLITAVVYGEGGQYCTHGYMEQVQTIGTSRAINMLKQKYAREWGAYYDNLGGWHDAKTTVFLNMTEEEFNEKYKDSKPHYITEGTYKETICWDGGVCCETEAY